MTNLGLSHRRHHPHSQKVTASFGGVFTSPKNVIARSAPPKMLGVRDKKLVCILHVHLQVQKAGIHSSCGFTGDLVISIFISTE